MKKILIASQAMEIGGAEQALLGLLNSVDYSKYQVHLFLYRHTGEFMPLIPREVTLLPEKKEYATLAVPMSNVIRKKMFRHVFGRIVGKIKANRFAAKNKVIDWGCISLDYSHKYTAEYMPDISQMNYDLAISFLTPHYFVAMKSNAKKKIAWIHSDYSSLDLDVESEYKIWAQYDNIISISESVTSAFIGKFPSLMDKIVLIENILSPELITEQSQLTDVSEEMPCSKDIVNILSIGRFSSAKNFDNVPYISKKIRERGINIKWYLIGYGSDENLIRQRITEAGMQDHVIILGKKANPYPYIKACDIYVQPSRYEGKSITVREAQIIGKPVIITDFATAHSQVIDGYDGIIVPLDNEKCSEQIVQLIKNTKKQNELISNCKSTNYDNKKEVEKLYELMG